MILDPLPAGPLPDSLLTELTALYASNHAFHTLSGDFPDPEDIRPSRSRPPWRRSGKCPAPRSCSPAVSAA